MNYVQLVEPNLSTVGRIGYCLEYARKCFGAAVVEPNAWTAWLNTKFKHPDHFTNEVSSLQWYSFEQGGINLGHVTYYVPNQGFYSSPWHQGTTHAVLPSIAEVERIYGVKYVGSSEDISNVRVIKEEDMVEEPDIQNLIPPNGDRPANDGDISYGVGQNWKDYAYSLAGLAKSTREAEVAEIQKKVDDLTAANQKLVDQLQAKPADPSIVVSKDSLWASFKKFLGL